MSQTSNDKFNFADRLMKLPPYLFVEIDKMKQKAMEEGVDIINLGVGDPDIPTPQIIRDKMKEAVDDYDNHQYPLGKGKKSFRQVIEKFMKKRFGVGLNPETQIQPLIGSKEGIAHLPLAFINPGEVAIIPEPAYPVYNSGTIFAGGKPYFVSLKEENNFLPDWSKVPVDILNAAKIIYINYPNNPTGAMATRAFFEETVKLGQKYGIIIAHDSAYTEMFYGSKPISLLEISGADEVGIEFHSLSKPFSMTGWRVGWACGNENIVEGLSKVKNNIDSGVFGAIQDAGITALENYDELVSKMCGIYKERIGVMAEGLSEAGWSFNVPEATFYIWSKPPAAVASIDAVKRIISETGIICTPGSGFGPSGEGFVRFALTKDVDSLKEAVKRIKEITW